jgi:putative salt-induced outer membrane protein YdiY
MYFLKMSLIQILERTIYSKEICMFHHRVLLLAMLLSLIGMAIPTNAQAQIVNILSPQVGEPPDGLNVKLGLSFNAKGGNSDSYSGGSEFGLRFKLFPHTLLVASSAKVAWANSQLNGQNAFGHIRYEWTFWDPVSLFSFVQAGHNKFQLLNLRVLGGVGLKVRLFRTENVEWTFGVSPMVEYEQITKTGQDDEGVFGRLSSFLAMAYEVKEWFTLSSTTFYQFMLTHPKDMRVLNETTMLFKINRYLSWKAAGTVAFDNRPPASVEKLDWSVSTGLVISFDWMPKQEAEEPE